MVWRRNSALLLGGRGTRKAKDTVLVYIDTFVFKRVCTLSNPALTSKTPSSYTHNIRLEAV
jgi:hypothetical protein